MKRGATVSIRVLDEADSKGHCANEQENIDRKPERSQTKSAERASHTEVEGQAHQRQKEQSDDKDHHDRYLIRGLVLTVLSLSLCSRDSK